MLSPVRDYRPLRAGCLLVGKLLGHRRHRTTAGYAHLADEHLVEAAEKVGSFIAVMMEGNL